ncbi:hypothetical protein TWF718_002174 [Orbilia javanica]|uniref:Protein kinase domain-containing protein n=1 Tax=Orbilia javanica TaxID=47235 RepID=A0AAN8MFL0_9PEZI
MTTTGPSISGGGESSRSPIIRSLRDLTLIEAWDNETNKPKYTTFYHVTNDEEVYFGESSKGQKDISFEEFTAALKRVPDDEIYPEVPEDTELTVAPDYLREPQVFVKRPGLVSYEELRGTGYIPKALLDEALIMEQISKSPHPNIIQYFGCRVRRGRITSILLKALDQSLTQHVANPNSDPLDPDKFIGALESAVSHLHSMGLAHNDINPDNIMVKDAMPVLIDFGGCQPFGKRVSSNGTEGWREEFFFTSEKKHDEYSLKKLREWFQKLE